MSVRRLPISRVLAVSLLAVGVLGLTAPRPAAAAVAVDGTFAARAACPAYQSFNKGTNPGMVTVQPGTIYGAFELNEPNGGWVHLRVPGAAPLDRWVARECGRLTLESDAAPAAQDGVGMEVQPLLPVGPEGGPEAAPATPFESSTAQDPAAESTPAAAPSGMTAGAASAVMPGQTTASANPPDAFPWFFDRVDDGPKDPTPPPPVLGQVDYDVLKLCGDWGATPSEADFRAFLDDHPGLRNTMITTLSGSPDAGDADLVRVWFQNEGFRHVFCGEPDRRGDTGWALGGMHYMGRYAQAQLNGWAGRLEGGCSVTEIAPPIYTEGVVFRAPDGTTGVKCVNGYALGLTAPDMLLEITNAVRDARRLFGNRGQHVCRRQVLDDGNSYQAIFVMRDGAIVTFYPDATPNESLPYCQ